MPVELPVRAAAKPPREITGRFVLVSLLLFFAVVASVNFTMLTLATRTFPGADARNGYDVSQAYNREIAAAREQADRGWRADMRVMSADGSTSLAFILRDSAGAPVRGLQVEGRLRHPTDRKQDHALRFEETAPGVYEANEAAGLRGAWDVEVTARDQGRKVYASQNRTMLKG